MPESPIRKLVPYAEAAKSKGIHVYHLNIGQPDIKTPKVALDAVKNNNIEVLAYSRTEGSEAYRRKIAAYYGKLGISLDSSEILVTTGGSEALSLVLGSLVVLAMK
jgi:aspartate aminotransferase